MSVASFGLIINLIVFAIGLWILYFVIRIAVKHGIDQSETARIIKEKQQNSNSNG